MGRGMNLRYAFRMLVKDPWFTCVAVLALGLGIGVNSTVFTFVNAVLLRGLPFANADQIVHINSRNTAEGSGLGVSYADYQDWRSQARSFASLAGYQPNTMNISDSGHAPERASGVRVTANAFGVVGERPIIGRGFLDGEDRKGAEPVTLHRIRTLEDPVRQRPGRHRPFDQNQRGSDDGHRRHGRGHEVSE